MTNSRLTIIILTVLPFLGILAGCEADHHDYIYKIKSSVSTPVYLTYKITDEDTFRHAKLTNGETLKICKRNGVSGDDIWDIETSSSIYMIESMVAANSDTSLITENLSIRSYWPGTPISEGDSGIYIMELTEQNFILSKQIGFRYEVTSEVEDSIIVASHISEGRARKDTLFADNKNAVIGYADIYIYNDKANKKESECRIKKLSGLYSISIIMKKDGETLNKSINLAKEDSLFTISEDGCLLNITGALFNKQQ